MRKKGKKGNRQPKKKRKIGLVYNKKLINNTKKKIQRYKQKFSKYLKEKK